MKNEDGSFDEKFSNQGAGGIWDHTSGKYWDSTNSEYSSIKKGRYTIEQSNTGWNVKSDLLKELTFGVSSPEPVVLNIVTAEMLEASRGAKIVKSGAGCASKGEYVQHSTDFAASLALARAAEGCTHLMFGDNQPGVPAYCCKGSDTSSSGWG